MGLMDTWKAALSSRLTGDTTERHGIGEGLNQMQAEILLERHQNTRALTHLVDAVVLALIVFIGGIQFVYYPHTVDFVTDPGYPDLARSLLDRGSYQIAGLPETTLPPGFPFMLALAGWLFGGTPGVQFRLIAVFTALGLITSYVLLRRLEGRAAAAAGCLLLGSSPDLFRFNTWVVFPEMPYLFMSILVLVMAHKIDRDRGRTSVISIAVASLALVFAVLIRSVGIALLLGLSTWIIASFLEASETALHRLKRLCLPLLLGLAAQAAWSMWAQRHERLEWQLPGYPQSYTAQLKVKNGEYPELGLAKLSDIPARVGRNIVSRAAMLDQILTGRYISPFWSSPAIAGLLCLIGLGLFHSLRRRAGLHDWYFLWYELIFWLWPWETEERFVYPIVPLAVLYLWRGTKLLKRYLEGWPAAVGACLSLLGITLASSSAAFFLRALPADMSPAHARADRAQLLLATLLWVGVAGAGAVFIRFHTVRDLLSAAKASQDLESVLRSTVVISAPIAGVLVLCVMVGTGLAGQIALAHDNLHIDVTKRFAYPEIAASNWIRTHEPSKTVIMARDQDMVFHYTARRVVWFPPISNPDVLMEGVRRNHVDVIIVAYHPRAYWLPSEDTCWRALAQKYGDAFHLINQGPDYQIFQVVSNGSPERPEAIKL